MSDKEEILEELEKCILASEALDLRIARLQHLLAELGVLTPVSLASFLEPNDK